ncbi:interferon-induced protein with tetratricopeptide repeats 5-like [Gopherus flavomarginatus]|uniref:interferon-induced protein with tetratricopeptide repeats 5-like n=1 Tax=Gopherus flavomarginatus TaxID=286002 RepID=UPI0021CBC3EE|nr:interferon-induced protein with tetratricopeptide repeats 5-like [Gopherus flavomarginatus]
MSALPLKEKLQALQCHFTWNFEIRDKVDAAHILQTLALRIAHTHYQNQPTLLAMQAYLCHLQGQYEDALQSLREAEEILQRDHPDNFPRQVLVIYGNYAWIYYHLAHYDLVELYLDKLRKICSSLKSRSPYAAQIPEIHAQKGWSLLAAGFRNGGEATKCFQMALREDEANGEFLAGLAIAVFGSWTHSHKSVFWNAAREKLGAIIHEQQQNYEAKVYLAKILKRTDRQQAEALLEDVVQNSLDPEVLRHAATFFLPEFLEKAISILQRAISLNPNYHLLHYDLGLCYKMQLRGDNSSRREEILAAAIEAFKKAVQKDPVSVFSKLALAEMYGENTPRYQEEIYLNLTSEMPSLSKKCQQAVSLHWGDFLFYKQKSLWEAAQIYKAGFAIPDNYPERQQLKKRLEEVAGEFQQSSQTMEAEDIHDFIQQNETPQYIGRSTGCSNRAGDWRRRENV